MSALHNKTGTDLLESTAALQHCRVFATLSFFFKIKLVI